MQIEKTGLFLSPLCQISNRTQQTCAIGVAVVHGNSSKAHLLTLLGGPVRYRIILHEDQSKSAILPSDLGLTAGQHLEGLLQKGEPWPEAATWKAELLLPLSIFVCFLVFLFTACQWGLKLRSSNWTGVSSDQDRRLSWLEQNTHASPCCGLVFLLQQKHFTVSSDGDGEGTYAYQERGKLESRRIEKTSPGNAKHAHSWDRVQCIMGEDRIQHRTDEQENK